MMEYRRVISYLYEYQGKEPGRNTGFVRLEVRNGQCRIRVFLKGGGQGQKVGRAVLFRSTGDPGQILLGTMPVRGSGSEGVFVTQSQNVAGSGFPLGDFCGVGVFPAGSNQVYCSFWDDRRPWKTREEPVSVSEPTEVTERAKSEKGTHSEEALEPESTGEVNPKETEKDAEEADPGDAPKDAEETNPGEMPYAAEASDSGMFGKAAEEKRRSEPSEEGSSLEVAEPEEAAADMTAQSLELLGAWVPETNVTWEQLWNTYPKYQPFGPEDSWEVLRISLQDIGRLPREYWHLGGNDFLVNGYCTHRHLILIRDGQEELYYLGVPGDNLAQDYRVAEMFGFRQYRPAGQNGYWLFRIKL